MKHNYLWFDMETTGLDPKNGRPLEVGVVLAADAAGDDLSIVDEASVVIHWPELEIQRLRSEGLICDYVHRLHEASGLWADVAASDANVLLVDDILLSVVEDLAGGDKHMLVRLAGNSVGQFDLQWCRAWFPKFAARLHHQCLDTSTLRQAAELWHDQEIDWGQPTHRALDDVHRSLHIARQFRKLVMS